MNRPHEDNPIAQDPALAALDRRLADELPARAPAGLADRIFAATAGQLHQAGRDVVGRIGWTQWRVWRYAAALGLIMFYLAAWSRPHLTPTPIPTAQVTLTQQVADPPDTALDQDIDALAAEVDRLSAALAGDASTRRAYTSADTGDFAAELYQLEQALDSGGV